ncbi:Cbr1 [Symbiodinium natans]|uniref:Cbr1 protein n=1 Tax=Symbiodinium natans TaxID=878477 RepID=A0A812LUE0_9DINO|nr:Cbr1 [Symbiodinium natans]
MAAALRYGLAFILGCFAFWNLCKMPFYWETEPMTDVTFDPVECAKPDRLKQCSGLTTQYHLYRAFGITSKYKLQCAKDLFLIPHTAMGVSLEILFIFALCLGDRGLYEHSKIMLPMAAIFAIHIIPAAGGIPNSLTGAPVNQTLVAMILGAVALGAYAMASEYNKHDAEPGTKKRASKPLLAAWLAIGVLVNLAPVGEWGILASSYNSKAIPDVPHPKSGHDWYTSLNAPWLGRIAAMFSLFTVFMYSFDLYAEARGERWRSPFSRDGPALWQLMRRPYPDVEEKFYQRPERWLEATGEMFVLCIGVSWLCTAMFNPGIFRDNILRSIVGYNNLCVGFDSPPARYVAMPLLVIQAVLASRYAYLDTIRLKATRAYLTDCQFWLGYVANTVFAVWMSCFPMLLVITAEFDSWISTEIHLFLFMATLFIMWAMIAGNVLEAQELECATKIWFGMFTFHTLALPCVGVVDVLNFYPDLKPEEIPTIRFEHPHPPVPWPIVAYLDYGWFILLMLTVVFLPEAPPVETRLTVDINATHFGKMEDSEMDDSEDSDSGEFKLGAVCDD